MPTEPEPITNQEIPVVADRIAAGLVTYALANIYDLLGQAISETISDDPDSPEDGTVERDDLWDAVIARLKAAPSEYQRRDQVLTEAASVEEGLRARLWLIEQAIAPIDVQQDPAGIVGMVGPILDGPLHPTDLAEYRAARTGREG